MTYSEAMRACRSAFAVFTALAGLLFTQVAIAVAAWDSPPSPCHEQAPATNFCFQHCSNNDLTLDVPRVKVPEAATVAVAIVVVTPARYVDVTPLPLAVLPAGPPPRILFQSFRS
jgi:hypothetical protein